MVSRVADCGTHDVLSRPRERATVFWAATLYLAIAPGETGACAAARHAEGPRDLAPVANRRSPAGWPLAAAACRSIALSP